MPPIRHARIADLLAGAILDQDDNVRERLIESIAASGFSFELEPDGAIVFATGGERFLRLAPEPVPVLPASRELH